MNTSQFKPFK